MAKQYKKSITIFTSVPDAQSVVNPHEVRVQVSVANLNMGDEHPSQLLYEVSLTGRTGEAIFHKQKSIASSLENTLSADKVGELAETARALTIKALNYSMFKVYGVVDIDELIDNVHVELIQTEILSQRSNKEDI